MAVDNLNFGPDFPKIGRSPTAKFDILESPWGGLQALKILLAKVQKQKSCSF